MNKQQQKEFMAILELNDMLSENMLNNYIDLINVVFYESFTNFNHL